MEKNEKNVNLPEIHYVEFNDTTLQTILKDGIQYVVMRRVVEGIGMDWANQYVKLNQNKDRFKCCDITTVGADDKQREMLCIPLTKLNGWLFSINPSKIPDPEIRNKVILYQEECFIVLHNYWLKGAAINSRVFDENIKVGLFDENAKTTNNINYAINGLCKTADQFLGGKAALTALNYFTGMPVDHLLKDLDEKHYQSSSVGQGMRIPREIKDFVKLMCELGADAEVKKESLYRAYTEFCRENNLKPEPINMFFKYLVNMSRVLHIQRRRKDGSRVPFVYGICLKTEVVEG